MSKFLTILKKFLVFIYFITIFLKKIINYTLLKKNGTISAHIIFWILKAVKRYPDILKEVTSCQEETEQDPKGKAP